MKRKHTFPLLLIAAFSINTYSQKEVDADKFYSFTKNYALVKKGNDVRFIDTLGNIISKMKVEQNISSIFSTDYGIQGNGLYITGKANYQGIKNTKGEFLFNPEFNIKKYHNYFILKPNLEFKKNELIIIDENGKIIYKDKFNAGQEILPVSNKLIAIKEKYNSLSNNSNNLFAIKNLKTGKTTEKVFSIVYPEVNGLIKAYKYTEKEGAAKWGFINTKFKTIIDFIYSKEPGDLIENRILVRSKGNKYGFIDGNGKLIIEPTYIEAKHFVNGYSLVKVHKRKYLADRSYNYGYRVIDINGKVIRDLKDLIPSAKFYFKQINPIENNGIIRVKIKNKLSYIQGLLDINSGMLTKTTYREIYRFNSGFAVVKFRSKNKKITFGYINKKGELLLVKASLNKF